MKHTKTVRLTALSALVALFVVTPAFAVNARAEEAQQRVEELKQTVTTKLEAKKLELCQKRQTTIQTRVKKMAEQGQKQIAVFDKIYERVKAFKETKGREVTNYDTLVQAVEDKQLAATAASTASTEAGAAFECGKDDPKDIIEQFKVKLQAQITALKEYKTAIKDLIVAVKSAQSDATKTTDGGTE